MRLGPRQLRRHLAAMPGPVRACPLRGQRGRIDPGLAVLGALIATYAIAITWFVGDLAGRAWAGLRHPTSLTVSDPESRRISYRFNDATRPVLDVRREGADCAVIALQPALDRALDHDRTARQRIADRQGAALAALGCQPRTEEREGHALVGRVAVPTREIVNRLLIDRVQRAPG